ncbi:type IX secretion system protein PorQ [Lutimonas vermicola]|uniref:Type IX secretion system protein PorQ n=1 Tax=Lutimonas vermicola TaxID=414288 RepID=A0ABU9KVN7_9FLAO
MKIRFSIVFFIIFQITLAQVGGERIYSFLNIPTSAPQAALGGEILTLNDDVNQPLWNPSTISKFMDNQIAVNYVNYLTDVNMGSATFAHLINRRFGTLHAGVQYIDYGEFIGADEEGNETGDFGARDLALSLGYAYNISRSDFYIGMNLKFLSSKIENFTSQGAAMDFGILYYSDLRPYSFTAVIRNLGYQFSPYDEKREEIAYDIAVGASYELSDVPIKWHLTINSLQQWNIAVANPSNEETDLDGNTISEDINVFQNAIRHFTIGAEFFPKKKFNLRLGYNFRRAAELKLTETRTFAGISAGFGLKMGRLKLDYAFTKYHPVDNSSTFTLYIDLTRKGF